MKRTERQVAGVPVKLYEVDKSGTEQSDLPVLFLHGAGSTGKVWWQQMRGLSGYGRMIALDLPGFAGAGEERFASLSDFAPFICRLLDELEIPAAVWVGNSLGGRIAVEAALERPERVLGLGLVCSAGVRLEGVHVASPHSLSKEEFDARLFYRPERFTALQTEESRQATMKARAYYDRLMQHTPQMSFQDRLGEIQVPAAVIWGRHDGVIPLAVGEAFACGIPRAKLTVLEASAHIPQVEQPQDVTASLRQLLQEVLLSQSGRA